MITDNNKRNFTHLLLLVVNCWLSYTIKQRCIVNNGFFLCWGYLVHQRNGEVLNLSRQIVEDFRVLISFLGNFLELCITLLLRW